MKAASSSTIVTIRDVAAAAGVHVSTVSRALDPARRSLISTEVLRSVERAAERLGYRANRAASALRTGRTRTIGVLVPDITNAVFPPILGGIEASASARGYFVFLANVPDPALAKEVVERMLAQQVAGVISAIATRDDPSIALLLRSKVAAVLVNRADETGRLSAVVSDDRLAMKLAVGHLVALGHKRIAHLAGPQQVPTGVARRQGFEQALRDCGLAPHAIIECDRYSRDAGRISMQRLLTEAAGATAVVCCNDLIALGAYDAVRAAGPAHSAGRIRHGPQRHAAGRHDRAAAHHHPPAAPGAWLACDRDAAGTHRAVKHGSAKSFDHGVAAGVGGAGIDGRACRGFLSHNVFCTTPVKPKSEAPLPGL